MSGCDVLVTGGGGHLGLHLVENLLERGHTVRVLDRASRLQSMMRPGLEFAVGDVRDRGVVGAAMEGTRLVIHAAFASPESTNATISSVNVRGTATVCEAALRGGASVVLISSTIVERPARRCWPRSSPLGRLEAYRVSRAHAEVVASSFEQRGLRLAVVRPQTFVGPEAVGGFAIMFERIRAGSPILLLGRGTNRYQLIDIRDLAEGISMVAERGRGLFRFGGAVFGTVAEDLQALVDHAATGSRLRIVPGAIARVGLRVSELIGLVPASEWHRCSAANRDSVVDTSRASGLGWEPRRTNAGALIDSYDGYCLRARAGAVLPVRTVPSSHRVINMVLGKARR